MPIDFGSLEADRREIAVPFGDETLNIVYQPSRMNAETESEVSNRMRRGLAVNALACRISRLVIEWDAMRDGETIPLDEDELGRLGHLNLSIINDAINADFGEARKTENKSAAGSRPTGK